MTTIPLFSYTLLKDVHPVASANSVMWLHQLGEAFTLGTTPSPCLRLTNQLYYRSRTWFYFRVDSVKQILKTDKLTTVGEVWMLYQACRSDDQSNRIVIGDSDRVDYATIWERFNEVRFWKIIEPKYSVGDIWVFEKVITPENECTLPLGKYLDSVGRKLVHVGGDKITEFTYSNLDIGGTLGNWFNNQRPVMAVMRTADTIQKPTAVGSSNRAAIILSVNPNVKFHHLTIWDYFKGAEVWEVCKPSAETDHQWEFVATIFGRNDPNIPDGHYLFTTYKSNVVIRHGTPHVQPCKRLAEDVTISEWLVTSEDDLINPIEKLEGKELVPSFNYAARVAVLSFNMLIRSDVPLSTLRYDGDNCAIFRVALRGNRVQFTLCSDRTTHSLYLAIGKDYVQFYTHVGSAMGTRVNYTPWMTTDTLRDVWQWFTLVIESHTHTTDNTLNPPNLTKETTIVNDEMTTNTIPCLNEYDYDTMWDWIEPNEIWLLSASSTASDPVKLTLVTDTSVFEKGEIYISHKGVAAKGNGTGVLLLLHYRGSKTKGTVREWLHHLYITPTPMISHPISRSVGVEKLNSFIVSENAIYDYSTLWDFIEPGETWKIEPYYANTLDVRCSVVNALSEYLEPGYFISKDHSGTSLRITEVENSTIKTHEYRGGMRNGTMLDWIKGLCHTGKVEQFYLSAVHKHDEFCDAVEQSLKELNQMQSDDETPPDQQHERVRHPSSAVCDFNHLWGFIQPNQLWRIEVYPGAPYDVICTRIDPSDTTRGDGWFIYRSGIVDLASKLPDTDFLRITRVEDDVLTVYKHHGLAKSGTAMQWINGLIPTDETEILPTKRVVDTEALTASTEQWFITALDVTVPSLLAISGTTTLEVRPSKLDVCQMEFVLIRAGIVVTALRLSLEQLDGFDIRFDRTALRIGRVEVNIAGKYPELILA